MVAGRTMLENPADTNAGVPSRLEPASAAAPVIPTGAAPSSAAGWTIKDWVTVIFSTASLIVSIGGFYFSNLLLDERLVVSVANVSPIYAKLKHAQLSQTLVESINAFEVALVLINAGNRPINLFEVSYNVAYKGDIREGGQGGPFVVNPSEIPASVPSRDCRVVRLRIPRDYLAHLYADGAPSEDDPEGRRLTWQLQFVWFDSSGRHEQVSDFIGTMRVIPSGATHLDWPGVYSEEKEARQYPPIVLRAPRPDELKLTHRRLSAEHISVVVGPN